MTIAIETRKITLAEFLEMPDDDHAEYELVKGEVVEMPKGSVSGRHGRVLVKVGRFLDEYASKNDLGTVYGEAGCTFQADDENYLRPDLAFVAKGRTPDDFDGPIPVAPDLVVEINSPGDTTERIYNKIEAYQQAGVRIIWSIYLMGKFVLIYRLNDPDIKLLNLKDDFEGEDVLPGFKLAVKTLF